MGEGAGVVEYVNKYWHKKELENLILVFLFHVNLSVGPKFPFKTTSGATCISSLTVLWALVLLLSRGDSLC